MYENFSDKLGSLVQKRIDDRLAAYKGVTGVAGQPINVEV